jgi:hypothetical protein
MQAPQVRVQASPQLPTLLYHSAHHGYGRQAVPHCLQQHDGPCKLACQVVVATSTTEGARIARGHSLHGLKPHFLPSAPLPPLKPLPV